jgi:hypothetical protein
LSRHSQEEEAEEEAACGAWEASSPRTQASDSATDSWVSCVSDDGGGSDDSDAERRTRSVTGEEVSFLGDDKSSRGDAESSLGDAKKLAG